MRVYLESLGCRLNAAEIEALARQFAGAGHEIIENPAHADLVVLNTCAVTAQAARKTRHRLRALHRRRPEADIAVTGCWTTEDLDRAKRFPGVRWVVPNPKKVEAAAEILGVVSEPAPWAPGRWGHTRAFLGVQDGCDHTCTYCVTHILRGPARSRPLADAVREVGALVALGAQEVVLTGVSLGAYGQDIGMANGLATLISSILADTDLPRLRLSSVEPWDVDETLLRQWENPRLCRQLHVPLQSGAPAVLRRMGRRITPDDFAALVRGARDVAPAIAITTDVITGFPGETEADFAQTLDFVAALAFARLHVFPYSERAGTPAVRLPGHLPPKVRRARARQLRSLGQQLAAAYRARFIGETLPVLWEQQTEAGAWVGLTGNYLTVHATTDQDLYNQIVATRLMAAHAAQGGFLDGEVLLA